MCVSALRGCSHSIEMDGERVGESSALCWHSPGQQGAGGCLLMRCAPLTSLFHIDFYSPPMSSLSSEWIVWISSVSRSFFDVGSALLLKLVFFSGNQNYMVHILHSYREKHSYLFLFHLLFVPAKWMYRWYQRVYNCRIALLFLQDSK